MHNLLEEVLENSPSLDLFKSVINSIGGLDSLDDSEKIELFIESMEYAVDSNIIDYLVEEIDNDLLNSHEYEGIPALIHNYLNHNESDKVIDLIDNVSYGYLVKIVKESNYDKDIIDSIVQKKFYSYEDGTYPIDFFNSNKELSNDLLIDCYEEIILESDLPGYKFGYQGSYSDGYKIEFDGNSLLNDTLIVDRLELFDYFIDKTYKEKLTEYNSYLLVDILIGDDKDIILKQFNHFIRQDYIDIGDLFEKLDSTEGPDWWREKLNNRSLSIPDHTYYSLMDLILSKEYIELFESLVNNLDISPMDNQFLIPAIEASKNSNMFYKSLQNSNHVKDKLEYFKSNIESAVESGNKKLEYEYKVTYKQFIEEHNWIKKDLSTIDTVNDVDR